MKAQISTEYFVVMGFIFLVSSVLIITYIYESNAFKDSVNVKQADNIVREVAQVADEMYYLGENSKTTIKAIFPNNILAANISNKTVLMKIGTSHKPTDVTAITTAPINGSLPTSKSLYNIEIQSKNKYVQINYR